MRDKTQRIILQYISASHAQLIHSHDDVFLTNKILTELKEEIERVENPYYLRDTDGGYYNQYPEFGVFDECRQAILKILES